MISIRQVAKLADVSPATVSRVINGTANVNKEKYERVLKVMDETGFKPNEVARSLFKKSAKLIGIIVPNIQNPFFNEMARVIEREAYNSNYKIMLCNSDNDLEKEKNYMELLSRMNADGIILFSNQQGKQVNTGTSHIPIIVLDREIELANQITSITADNYKGGRLAMEHLIACGCKNIVCMKGIQTISSARNRFEGYLSVCKEHGIAPRYIDCRYSYHEGLEKTKELLEIYPDVDGIIACNDMVAISAYKVLTKAGYHVPKDIQLVGFDNIDLSRLMTPELTTVAQPITRMGEFTVKVLLDHIEEKEIKKNYVFDVELLERETTYKVMKYKGEK